jgi:hypothetical protein
MSFDYPVPHIHDHEVLLEWLNARDRLGETHAIIYAAERLPVLLAMSSLSVEAVFRGIALRDTSIRTAASQ